MFGPLERNDSVEVDLDDLLSFTNERFGNTFESRRVIEQDLEHFSDGELFEFELGEDEGVRADLAP